MASTSLATFPAPSVTQSTSPNTNGPNTAVIVGVVVGVIVMLVLASVIFFRIFRRKDFRRKKVQPRRQNTLDSMHIRLSSAGHDKLQISAPLLNDQKHEKPYDNPRRHALYDPRHAPYGSSYENHEHSVMEGQEHAKESHAFLPPPRSPHSPTSNANLAPLVIPEFKPLSVMLAQDASRKASPTDDAGSGHVSATSSALEDSPVSIYSQASAMTERFPPPVPPIPDHLKSRATDNTRKISRGNTRVIGMMLKQRAKHYSTDATSHLPSPISPIERSGSIRPAFSPIADSEDEKPPMRSRIAQQRKKTLPPPLMDTLLEVPDSAVSASTSSSFPVISWEFPGPPAPPAPTLLPTTLRRASSSSHQDPVQPYADVSPLKISKPRDRDPSDTRDSLPWGGHGVHLREGSVEKAMDVSYLKTRFQSTYGEIEYRHP
jgi:hypothetical protein